MGFFSKTLEDQPDELDELIALNARLDDEMDHQINKAIESEILLPRQVTELKAEKEELQDDVNRLRNLILELEEERRELGGKSLKQLLKEKNDLTTEIQLMEETAKRGVYVMNTVCSGTPIGGFFPSGARI